MHGISSRLRGLLTAPILLLSLACSGPEPTPAETLTGRLQRLSLDRPDRGESQLVYVLERDGGRQSELRFAGSVDLPTGARLKVGGRSRSADESPALFGDAPPFMVERFQLLEPAHDRREQSLVLDPARAPPPRKLGVFLLNFQNDDRQPMTVAEARRKIFLDPDSTRAFYKEQSYGVVDLVGKSGPQGDVFGWYTIPAANRPCNPSAWGEAALAAARAAGVDTAGYDLHVFFFPATEACPYLGLGQQPGRNTWMNGVSVATFNHELGHNLGTPHAGARACTGPGNQRVTLGDSCRDSEYGNPFDVMGAQFRHTHAYNKAQARWLTGSNLQEVTRDGIYTLLAQERPSNGVQLLSIWRETNSYFHLEYRQPMGFDDFPPTSPAVNGIIVVLGGNVRQFAKSVLLDMTPETTSFDDAPLAVGKSFEDSRSGVRITLLDRNAQSARVEIKFTKPPPAADAGAPAPAPADGGPADAGAVEAAAEAGAADRPAAGDAAESPPGTGGAPGRPRSVDGAVAPTPPPEKGGCTLAAGGRARGASGELLLVLLLGAASAWRRSRRRVVREQRPRWLRLAFVVGAAALGLVTGCSGGSASYVSSAVSGAGGAAASGSGGRPASGAGGSAGNPAGGAVGATDAAAADRGAEAPSVDAGVDSLPGDGPPPPQITLFTVEAPAQEACRRYAEVSCARLEECRPRSFLLDHGMREICRARREQACRIDFLVPGRNEQVGNRTACTDSIAAQSCRDMIVGRRLLACDPPGGTLPPGAPCFSQSQCGRGLRCKVDADVCGTCQPAIPAGGDCGWWAGGCVLGTRCYDDRCLAPRRLGESCKTSSAPCDAGLACGAQGCVERTTDAGGSCAAADTCNPEKGLFCSLTTKVCQPLPTAVAAGERCETFNSEGGPLLCGDDATCFAPASAGVTASKSCVAKVELGQPCDTAAGKLCKAPATCSRGICQIPRIVEGGQYMPTSCR